MDRNSGNETRRKVLEPYLSKLSGLGAHREEESKPSVLRIGGRTLRVDAWERQRVLQSLEPWDGQDSWTGRLAEGIALQTKSLMDLAHRQDLGDTDPSKILAAVERLQVDAAIALALMEETRQEVDHLVEEAREEEARNLASYRSKLGKTLDALRESLDEAALSRAETLAEEYAAQASVTEEEPAVPYTPRRRRSKIPALIGVLVLAIAGWSAWNSLNPSLSYEPPVLTVKELGNLEPVDRVISQPPNLFIIIDRGEWLAMDAAGQTALLERIAATAESTGFAGALLRSRTGQELGQWSSYGGTEILNSPETLPGI